MANLIGPTVVLHPETHTAVRFKEGDLLPEWANDLVGAHLLDGVPTGGRHSGPRETGQEPPRGGAGSGSVEWAAFAQEKGVKVVPGSSRDAIIDQLVHLELIAATPAS